MRGIIIALAAGLVLAATTAEGQEMDATQRPDARPQAALETATLGGGCFWCLEAVYEELTGVRTVISGYAGGDDPDPSYEEVCSGRSGHAEVVQVVFDPREIAYEEILAVFFSIHDPTTRDQQGADIGSQYRSVVFYHDERQKQAAEAMIRELDARGIWDDPIVTQVVADPGFHPAERYHQDYYRRNPAQGYCQAVISPKLSKFRKEFAERLKR